MFATVIKEYGGPEQLVIKELPTPTPGPDEVLIKVKAFGLNHAETYMRQGAWENKVPIIGIECVGQVEHDPSGALKKGTTVAAIMGGMGRTRNGSYAEYACPPATNVMPLKTEMAWVDLAALPESYATAWSCLFDNLCLDNRDSDKVLLVRGATSTIGQAAVNIASEMGVTVLATTRSREKEPILNSIGATTVLIEDANVTQNVRGHYPAGIDYVLDLIGNSGFLASARTLKKDGRVCVAGWLGGLAPVPFDGLTGLQPGVHISLFGSFLYGTRDYPLSRIPMQTIVNRAAAGLYKAKPVRVFDFKDLPDAHRLLESNNANGKIVVQI